MQLSHAIYSQQNGQRFWGAPFPGVGLDNVPDIPSLQAWIELAWLRGYDDAGAHHYNNILQVITISHIDCMLQQIRSMLGMNVV